MQEPPSPPRNAIQFSNKALHVLMAYRNAFPLLFQDIRDTDSSHSLADYDYDMIMAAHRYVNELDIKSDCHMDQFSACASPVQTQKLGRLGEEISKKHRQSDIRIELPAADLAFWERDNFTLSRTTLQKVIPVIGDRVVIISGNDVPIGRYGFVVAVHPQAHRVELVMDKPFVGGTNLLGLLETDYRGAYDYHAN